MSPKAIEKRQILIAVAVWILGPGHAGAQSADVCGTQPFLGTSGPEICISIVQSSPAIAPIYFRVPVTPGLAPPTITAVSAGEYIVDTMTVAYASGPTGIAISMTGTVTRVVAGNATLTVTAIGGWGGTPVVGGAGTISLSGSANGTSRTIAGAAAGRPAMTFPSQDVVFTGFPLVVDVTTAAAGSFADALPPQPLPDAQQTVAIQLIVAFHVNDVGTSTTIPAGAGIAPAGSTPPMVDSTPAGGKPHFACYAVHELRPVRDEKTVTLADQFMKVERKIGQITRLCTPVDKNNHGIPDPDLHLVCYEILKGHDPHRRVETKDQFGKSTMLVRKAQELCVPSVKKLVDEEQRQEQAPK